MRIVGKLSEASVSMTSDRRATLEVELYSAEVEGAFDWQSRGQMIEVTITELTAK